MIWLTFFLLYRHFDNVPNVLEQNLCQDETMQKEYLTTLLEQLTLYK